MNRDAPPGYSVGAWLRLLVDLDELAEDAHYGSDLAAVVRLARRPLDLDEVVTASARPWEDPSRVESETRIAEQARADRELRVDAEIEAAALSGKRLVVSLTASGERRIRRLDPAALERRRRVRAKQVARVAARKPARHIPRGAAVRLTTSGAAPEVERIREETTQGKHTVIDAALPKTKGKTRDKVGALDCPRYLLSDDAMFVPEAILDAVRLHAQSAEPNFEVGGVLLVGDDRRVRRYHELRNDAADEPRKFRTNASWYRLYDEVESVVLHTHPSASAGPSAGDLRWARTRPLYRKFAIYSAVSDAIRFFEIAKNRRGYIERAVVVE